MDDCGRGRERVALCGQREEEEDEEDEGDGEEEGEGKTGSERAAAHWFPPTRGRHGCEEGVGDGGDGVVSDDVRQGGRVLWFWCHELSE